MTQHNPWDDIDLATALETGQGLGIELPLDAAIAIVLGVLHGIDANGRLEEGGSSREAHGPILPSLVRISAAGEVSLDTPGPLTADRPDELRFVAPEVTAGSPPTPRSDVFAVGALLFEMSSGQRIAAGPCPVEVARQIQSLDPVALLHPHRPVLGELTDLLVHALAPDPVRRYATTGHFAEALQAVVRRRGAGPGATVRFLETVFRSEASTEFDAEPALPGAAEAFDAFESTAESSSAEVVLGDDTGEAPRAPWELQDDPIIAALGLVPLGGTDEAAEAPPLWSDGVDGEPASSAHEVPFPDEPSPWEPGASSPSGDGARSGDDEDALTSQVREGAFLFADGRSVGPLPLLEMDRELARVRDPAALVAFEVGSWRPVHECASVHRKAPKGVRRSFGLLDLGAMLLEFGAGPRLNRLALWSGESAVMLELGQSRVWRAEATDVEPMLRRMVRVEGLLSTDSLPDDDTVAHDEAMLRWLEAHRMLNVGQVARLRRQILRRAAAAPFGWERGEVMIQDIGPCPPSSSDTIDLAEAITFAVRDRSAQPIVEGALYREREKHVVVTEGALERCAGLPLKPVEARFIAELPPRQPLTEALVGGWCQGRENSFALLFLCVELAIVRLE